MDQHFLPQIQSIRNSGFKGSSIHKSKSPDKRGREKMEVRKFIPVNQFITNNHININVYNNITIE